MSYIDETYGKQLEEALRGLVSRPALGQPWFGFHESEVPAGVLLFTAATHSRVLYADFWKYIQGKNLVKTEEEWQSIYSAQGWCPFYSDGDGIDTFRMPSAPLYLHGADTLSEAGQYAAEGLPGITGSFVNRSYASTTANGIYGAVQSFATEDVSTTGAGGYKIVGESSSTSRKVSFDASRSNPIYGNSQHVTPETSKMLFGVWAIAASQQPIPDVTTEGLIVSIKQLDDNKADLNLFNLSTEGKEVAAKMGMPSGRYVDLTLGASGTTYIMPADGWLLLRKGATQASFINLSAHSALIGSQTWNTGETWIKGLFVPVKKNDGVFIHYTADGPVEIFRFIYAEGAE